VSRGGHLSGLMLPLPSDDRTITPGGHWSMVRVGLARFLIVLLCTVALLWQTAVSSGALLSSRCECAMGGQRSASEPDHGCPCCAKNRHQPPRCPACGDNERDASCCSPSPSDSAPCRCWSHRHDTQVAESYRDRLERQEMSWVGWLDVPATPTVDHVRPLETRTAFRPPGVRLQSLFCVWRI